MENLILQTHHWPVSIMFSVIFGSCTAVNAMGNTIMPEFVYVGSNQSGSFLSIMITVKCFPYGVSLGFVHLHTHLWDVISSNYASNVINGTIFWNHLLHEVSYSALEPSPWMNTENTLKRAQLHKGDPSHYKCRRVCMRNMRFIASFEALLAAAKLSYNIYKWSLLS
jgi:hypothetical protein